MLRAISQRIKSQALLDGINAFINDYMPARNFTQRTRETYEDDVAQLARFLEARDITDWKVVGLRDLRQFVAELERQRFAASSRHRKVYALKTFFKFLHQDGYLRENPATGLIPPSVERKEVRYLTEEEYQAVLAQTNKARDRAILILFLQTGLRVSELTRISLHDLTLPKRIHRDEVGKVTVLRKGRKRKTLYFNWKACEALQDWLKERKRMLAEVDPQPDALFINKLRAPLAVRSVQNIVKKYLKRAGITDASAHSLRHTAATTFLLKGTDIRTVQEIMDHESIRTTQEYLHVLDLNMQEAVKRL